MTMQPITVLLSFLRKPANLLFLLLLGLTVVLKKSPVSALTVLLLA
jgi:hypothetical protein